MTAAASLVVVGFVADVVLNVWNQQFVRPYEPVVFILSYTSIPIAAAASILRYGLYEIDFIINRAIVYVSLTAILAGLYAGFTATLQKTFVAATGESSDAAIVITVALIATLFTPVRNALQRFVDARFKDARDLVQGQNIEAAAAGLVAMTLLVAVQAGISAPMVAFMRRCSLLDTGMRDRLLTIDGVAEAVPLVVGFSAWSLPDGAMTPVVVVGSDSTAGGLPPWNVVGGDGPELDGSGDGGDRPLLTIGRVAGSVTEAPLRNASSLVPGVPRCPSSCERCHGLAAHSRSSGTRIAPLCRSRPVDRHPAGIGAPPGRVRPVRPLAAAQSLAGAVGLHVIGMRTSFRWSSRRRRLPDAAHAWTVARTRRRLFSIAIVLLSRRRSSRSGFDSWLRGGC
jgi:hypothetical protein